MKRVIALDARHPAVAPKYSRTPLLSPPSQARKGRLMAALAVAVSSDRIDRSLSLDSHPEPSTAVRSELALVSTYDDGSTSQAATNSFPKGVSR